MPPGRSTTSRGSTVSAASAVPPARDGTKKRPTASKKPMSTARLGRCRRTAMRMPSAALEVYSTNSSIGFGAESGPEAEREMATASVPVVASTPSTARRSRGVVTRTSAILRSCTAAVTRVTPPALVLRLAQPATRRASARGRARPTPSYSVHRTSFSSSTRRKRSWSAPAAAGAAAAAAEAAAAICVVAAAASATTASTCGAVLVAPASVLRSMVPFTGGGRSAGSRKFSPKTTQRKTYSVVAMAMLMAGISSSMSVAGMVVSGAPRSGRRMISLTPSTRWISGTVPFFPIASIVMPCRSSVEYSSMPPPGALAGPAR